MSELHVLSVTLYVIVFITLLTNISQVLRETKVLKQQGRTPLVGKNFTTVGIAALAEAFMIWAVTGLAAITIGADNLFKVVIVFLATYLMRNVGAYLAAWGTWTLFVKLEKRKMIKEGQLEEAE